MNRSLYLFIILRKSRLLLVKVYLGFTRTDGTLHKKEVNWTHQVGVHKARTNCIPAHFKSDIESTQMYKCSSCQCLSVNTHTHHTLLTRPFILFFRASQLSRWYASLKWRKFMVRWRWGIKSCRRSSAWNILDIKNLQDLKYLATKNNAMI